MPVKVVHYNERPPMWADEYFMDWLWQTLQSEGGGSRESVFMTMEQAERGALQVEGIAQNEYCIVVPRETAREIFGLCATLQLVNHIDPRRTIPKAIEAYIRTHTKAKA